MISTYFGIDRLDSPQAFFAALVIGLFFGFALERAGFGSSRKLAGIFYFKDMTVMKVMFTGLIVAMLGLSAAIAMGWIAVDQVYAMPTIYGAQVVGGLLFGVGFVLGGWCPGTAAVGSASGKIDAIVFLGGAVIGSILFSETYGALGWLDRWGAQEETLVAFGVSRPVFGLLFTGIAVGAFYFAEWAEGRFGQGGRYLKSPFLKAFSLALLAFAAALLVFPSAPGGSIGSAPAVASHVLTERALLESIEAGDDHIEPEDLADRLMAGRGDLVLVDVRPAAEFEAFHIRGAVNVALADLPGYLDPHKNRGTIVLYSNGMTHPAEARDSLARLGFSNALLLTDGLAGFIDRCLKPVSLRREPLSPGEAARVRAWRAHFIPTATSAGGQSPVAAEGLSASESTPKRVSTEWAARPELPVVR